MQVVACSVLVLLVLRLVMIVVVVAPRLEHAVFRHNALLPIGFRRGEATQLGLEASQTVAQSVVAALGCAYA